MYQVLIDRNAAKEIGRLQEPVLSSIIDALDNLAHQPRPRGSRKLAGGIGWRIRVGNYRILYSVDDPKRTVAIYRVKHRRDAYR